MSSTGRVEFVETTSSVRAAAAPRAISASAPGWYSPWLAVGAMSSGASRSWPSRVSRVSRVLMSTSMRGASGTDAQPSMLRRSVWLSPLPADR
jgi:hypothetical protein